MRTLETMISSHHVGPISRSPYQEPIIKRRQSRIKAGRELGWEERDKVIYGSGVTPSQRRYIDAIQPITPCFECGKTIPLDKARYTPVHAADNLAIRSVVGMCQECSQAYEAGDFAYLSRHIYFISDLPWKYLEAQK